MPSLQFLEQQPLMEVMEQQELQLFFFLEGNLHQCYFTFTPKSHRSKPDGKGGKGRGGKTQALFIQRSISQISWNTATKDEGLSRYKWCRAIWIFLMVENSPPSWRKIEVRPLSSPLYALCNCDIDGLWVWILQHVPEFFVMTLGMEEA